MGQMQKKALSRPSPLPLPLCWDNAATALASQPLEAQGGWGLWRLAATTVLPNISEPTNRDPFLKSSETPFTKLRPTWSGSLPLSPCLSSAPPHRPRSKTPPSFSSAQVLSLSHSNTSFYPSTFVCLDTPLLRQIFFFFSLVLQGGRWGSPLSPVSFSLHHPFFVPLPLLPLSCFSFSCFRGGISKRIRKFQFP